MKRFILTLVLGLFVTLPLVAQNGFKPLFNGKNLNSWQTPELEEAWTIVDGILVVNSDEDKTGSILWTKNEYNDFIVKADFKFGEGTVDSGIFLRNDSQQIQIGESGSLKRDMTGSPYIPGKGYPVEAENVKNILNMDDWNTIQVQAKGNKYTTWLNGVEVMNYTSENAVESGPIGLQLHPNREMTIYFKNIGVKKLK